MQYLNDLKDKDGKVVDVDGHTHTKEEISNMPTALSQFANDLGFGRGTVFTISATAPSDPMSGDFWYKIL